MLDFEIRDNIFDVERLLSNVEKRHLPFAAARGLNRTVATAQKEVRRRLSDRFTIRRDWTSKGIRIKVATKRNLEALLYTLDWYMEHQEEGAQRGTLRGGPRFVPTLAAREGGTFKGEVKAPRGETLLKISRKAALQTAFRKRRRKVGAAKAAGRRLAFIAKTRTGKRGLFVRVGGDRLPIVLLYTLADSVRVPPRWGFEGTVGEVSDKHLRREFLLSLEEALADDRQGPIKNWAITHLLEHGPSLGARPFGLGGGTVHNLAR